MRLGPVVERADFFRRGALSQPMPEVGSTSRATPRPVCLHQTHQLGKHGAISVRNQGVGMQGSGGMHLFEHLSARMPPRVGKYSVQRRTEDYLWRDTVIG